MKVTATNNISFQRLKFNDDGYIRVFNDYPQNSDTFQKDVYSVSLSEDRPGNYKMNFYTNDKSKPAASEYIRFLKNHGTMHVYDMFTQTEKRERGLGSSMHLLGIIELIENNYNKITLDSAASAIGFHTRFGFRPNADSWHRNIELNITRIASEESPELKTYADRADELLYANICTDDKIRAGNKLIEEYTKAALKTKTADELRNIFRMYIPMVLKKEEVLDNKNFYNKILNKYGIDYEI